MKDHTALQLNTRYTIMQIPYWMGYSILMTFASVFLLSRGFNDAHIGVVLAAANLFAVLLQPFTASFADASSKITLSRLSGGLALIIIFFTVVLIFLPKLFIPTAVIYIILACTLMVLQPMVISIGTFFISRGYPLNFGLTRGIGSLAFAAASAIVGWLVDRYQANVILYAILVVFTLFFFAVHLLDTRKKGGAYSAPYGKENKPNTTPVSDIADRTDPVSDISTVSSAPDPLASEQAILDASSLDTSEALAEELEHPSSLLYFFRTYKKFMCLLVGVSLLFAFHNIINNYLYQIMQPLGGTASSVGTSLSIAAICELPTMFLFGWMLKHFTCKNLVKTASLFFTIKAFLFLIAGSLWVINFAQIFQMFSFALHTAASVYYTSQIIAEKDQVKGQALMTTANTVGGVLGSLLGGQMLTYLGVPSTLFIGTIVSAVGTVIVFFSAQDPKK